MGVGQWEQDNLASRLSNGYPVEVKLVLLVVTPTAIVVAQNFFFAPTVNMRLSYGLCISGFPIQHYTDKYSCSYI